MLLNKYQKIQNYLVENKGDFIIKEITDSNFADLVVFL